MRGEPQISQMPQMKCPRGAKPDDATSYAMRG